MGLLEETIRRLFNSSPREASVDDPLKQYATPSHSPPSLFDTIDSTPSSSTSSVSSSGTFWMSPTPPRWSLARCVPARLRTSVSKKQIAVVVCLVLALGFWTTPPPSTWKRNVVHVNVQQFASNPYQILRPSAMFTPEQNGDQDPTRWLEHNSENKHAEVAGTNPYLSVPALGHKNTKPRAALISLVRNSELPGLIQSMQQLEFQWNRKYNYPWIFFNDEPFTDGFKVCIHSMSHL